MVCISLVAEAVPYAALVEGPAERSRDERVRVAADNLRVDAVTAEAGRAFDRAGVASILLKGPSIARWLYSHDEPRGYLDCDLLVCPGDIEGAEAILADLGFSPRYDPSGLPDWWRDHAHEWWRADDAVCVDLHKGLTGVGIDDEAAWPILWASTETFVVARYPARALSVPARALHIALHAAHHGAAWGKVLPDLERALEEADDGVWAEAAALAARLAATDAFAVGLRLLPAGAGVADRLGLPANRSVEAALHAGSPPPLALGFEQLARADGTRARARIVARKVIPPPGFMRHWYPPAARSRRALVFAYLYRPVWLLRSAARGWRAWREARRRVRMG